MQKGSGTILTYIKMASSMHDIVCQYSKLGYTDIANFGYRKTIYGEYNWFIGFFKDR